MFFTASNLVHYLLSRGLLRSADVTGNAVMVLDARRRNRNFKVIIDAQRGLFVKQVSADDAARRLTLEREIVCYQLAAQFPQWASLVPDLIDHDDRRQSLVLQLFPHAENIREYHVRVAAYSTTIGGLIGEGLGRFHTAVPLSALSEKQQVFFRRKPSWILSFKEANDGASGAVVQLLRYLQEHPELAMRLETLGSLWRFEHVIHGDMKWDNCIVFVDENQEAQMKIVDWELLDIGDSCWDIGGIFHSYWVHWIQYQVNRRVDHKDLNLFEEFAKAEALIAAMRAFWLAYISALQLTGEAGEALLLRAIEHGAARLVLTVYELAHEAARLFGETQLMLALSERILAVPEQFAACLLQSIVDE